MYFLCEEYTEMEKKLQIKNMLCIYKDLNEFRVMNIKKK